MNKNVFEVMKKGAFLFIVVAFAILSGFVFYLDSFLDCGSIVCVKNYITGNVVFEDLHLTGNVVIDQTPEDKNPVQKFFSNLIERIILPFLGEGGGEVLLGPTHVLTPGTGWSGLTSTPGPVGSSSTLGYDANIVAHWDEVPFRDINGIENVGVMAYHINGIQKVSFSVNNGGWVDVTTPILNP